MTFTTKSLRKCPLRGLREVTAVYLKLDRASCPRPGLLFTRSKSVLVYLRDNVRTSSKGTHSPSPIMLLDISRPFEDFCTIESFRDALTNLSTILRPRNESETWARRLRFLCPALGYAIPSDIGDDGTNEEDDCVCHQGWKFETTREEDTLIVTDTEDFPGCSHHVAVSWC